MKKYIGAILMAAAGLSGLFAADKEIQGFTMHTPRTTGMGNAYISMAKGAEALWINPACFNSDTTELTILGLNASVLGRQSDLSKINAASLGGSSLSKMVETLEPVISGSGAGFDVGTGISWVGKRVGVGVYDDVTAYVQGEPFPTGTTGYMDNTLAIMGGYAHPFPITDTITITAGIAVRPSFKWRLTVDESLIKTMLSSDSGTSSIMSDFMGSPVFGLPIDLGVRATFPQGLSAAMTLKDIYTRYSTDSITGNNCIVPISWNIGGAWHPDLGTVKPWFDPIVSLEISNLNKIIGGKTGFFRELHIGTELSLLKNFITVWGGLDGGYPALGTNFDLFIMDLSLAYGTTEYGRYLGDRPVSNLTVEVSFRID